MENVSIKKILFIDDGFDDDEDLQNAVLELVKSGISVQYWDSQGEFPENITNARIVVMDLDLADVKSRGDPHFYSAAAKALKKIPGPFIAILMARDYTDADPGRLKHYYSETFPTPFCGFIAEKGLTKTEESANPQKLNERILEAVEKNAVLKFILAWEEIVAKAQSSALHDLFEKELETTIMALVKSLCKGLGDQAAAREMFSVILQIVNRKVAQTTTFTEFTNQIAQLNKITIENIDGYPSNNDLSLYNKLMFYEPGINESELTGDIYKTNAEFFQYAIILTPRCDIVQGKTKNRLFCFGVPLIKEEFKNPNNPLHKIDSSVARRHKKSRTTSQILNYMNERYFKKGDSPETLHILWNFCYNEKTFGICFDFNKVQSLNLDKLNWKRVCRLDSPFVEEMLDKYGSVVSRVGTMDINQNAHKLKGSLREEIETRNVEKSLEVALATLFEQNDN